MRGYYDIPNFYKPLAECSVKEDEFNACPICDNKPRLWIFDNGEFAKCGCNKQYDKASASGMTIWEYHKLHNGDMTNWNHNDLRDNWNKVVKERTQ